MNIKVKLNQNDILHGDFVVPETPIASFNDQLTRRAKKHFVNSHNHGIDLLNYFEQVRSDLNLSNVHEVLSKMDDIYRNYDKERYAINKKEF